jgi:hypothetical protein
LTELGLALNDFWALAPVDFYHCLKQAEHKEARKDWRAGLIAAVFANAFGKGPNGKPFSPEDFMPRRPKREPPPSEAELEAKARLITSFFGGQVVG